MVVWSVGRLNPAVPAGQVGGVARSAVRGVKAWVLRAPWYVAHLAVVAPVLRVQHSAVVASEDAVSVVGRDLG